MEQSLALVQSPNAIKQNLQLFNSDSQNYPYRALTVMQQTTYWIYDDDLGLFSPSKFSAYEDMNFDRYEQALRGEIDDPNFDGNRARKKIEDVLRKKFAPDPELCERLTAWGEKIAGPRAFENVKSAKWRFLRLSDSRRYWAFCSNPKHYKLQEAVEELQEDIWRTKEHRVRLGDRVLLWQAKGNGKHRGVVGFGEIVSDPAILSVPREHQRYSVNPDLLRPALRVKVKIVRVPNPPLWLNEANAFLADLSVARATGGSIFNLTAEQWHQAFHTAGGTSSDLGL